jgi:AcrR family transcriptional regulator
MKARAAGRNGDDPPTTPLVERETRREGGRELPLGPKARRTRTAILRAAAEVFATNGYRGTTMADIAAAAGVSLGTVYQYFRDRSDVVASLVQVGAGDMLAGTNASWRAADGIEGVYRLILAFVSAYVEAAPIAGLWEEVAHHEPDLAAHRRSLSRAFAQSLEEEYARAAAAGLVEADLNPPLVARALTSMVDRYCYVTYVFDPPERGVPTPEESARLLARLWAGGIKLVPSS